MSVVKHRLRLKAANFIQSLGIDGIYSGYKIDSAEYLFTLQPDEIDVRIPMMLDDWGYEYQVLGAKKTHPETEETDDGSWRRVPSVHPDVDCRLTRNWRPKDCQYHIHYWKRNGEVDFFIHYELRPDIFSPTISPRRLREHYRPVWDTEDKDNATYLLGQPDPNITTLIERAKR